MSRIPRPTRRSALIAGAAGLAVVGALGVGTAALAADDAAPAPDASAAPSPPADGERPARVPHIGGETLSVSGSTITVEDRDGFTRTIELADDVTVTEDGEESTSAAIEVGDHIEARGAVADDGTTLAATEVAIGEPTSPAGGPEGGPGRGPKGAPENGTAPVGPKDGTAPAAPEGEAEAPTPDASTK